MTGQEHFEALVIGSGEGGKYLAWHLARGGQRTAVVERRWIGGSCPNINCLPSKNEIWSAKVAELKRKRHMVDGLVRTHLDLYSASGAELIMGNARLTGPNRVEIALNDGGTRVLTADRLFLNLGTHATIPDIAGLAAAKPLTNIEALELDRLPRHLLVLGGGYVGLEMAQAFRRFGADVTVLEGGTQLAGREDPDIAAALLDMLREDGVTVHLGAQLREVTGRSGEGVVLRVETTTGDLRIEGSDILVATGRTPNTADIGLDLAGVELDARGYIRVNERLQTTAPDTWAIGECAGSPQFTHVS
jgi:pyruvate/2-oxoglutarate dehydrogenase complex dihydrolipoamide dehydrogenase (E3) component